MEINTESMWGIAIYIYPQLPDVIPTHFNITGKADNYGHKIMLWLIPALGTLMFIGFTVLSRFPHIYNYPIEITAKNAEGQYRNGAMLMRLLKLSLTSVFLINLIETKKIVEGGSSDMEHWSLILSLGLIALPIIYFLVRSSRL